MNIVLSGTLSMSGYIHHAETVEAMKKGNPEVAADALRADIQGASESIRAVILQRATSTPQPDAR